MAELSEKEVIEAIVRERNAWPKSAFAERFAVERMAYSLALQFAMVDRHFDADKFLTAAGYPKQEL